jgi:phospholipase C
MRYLTREHTMSPAANPLKKIQHIVVLMLENRSFDSLLGWLYDPANPAPYNIVPPDFDGLSGKSCSNRAPDGRTIPAGKTDDPRSPQPNPGEPFEDVFSQLFDTPFEPDLAKIPSIPPHSANMQGFIRNYDDQKDKPADPTTIMNSLTPKTIPILSALAHNYALCDRWFSSIPTQTFCNRSFVHAGTSSGYVNNGGGGPVFVNDATTVFDLLEEARKSWKIFVGGWLLESFTLLTQKHLWKYTLTDHFSHFKEFVSAAKAGTLPNYSFIEPVYFDSVVWGPHNDMHPECNLVKFFGPSNLHRGEALLWTIYDAIRNGPRWQDTMLIILFDEHGGCYDHVSPPTAADSCPVATLPDRTIQPGQKGFSGFQFDRLGPRVPAIIVSAYTDPQTRLHHTFEHTSVLSTIVNCFDLPQGKLGARQTKALDVSAAITREDPRNDEVPLPKPTFSILEEAQSELHMLAHTRLLGAKQKPVSDLQKHALHAAALFTQDATLNAKVDQIENELQADLLLAEHEAKLVENKIFGP